MLVRTAGGLVDVGDGAAREEDGLPESAAVLVALRGGANMTHKDITTTKKRIQRSALLVFKYRIDDTREPM